MIAEMFGSTSDLRPLLASHALDDISVCGSDDESCSVIYDQSSVLSPPSPPTGGGDEADLLAIVTGSDQQAAGGKYSYTASQKSRRTASKPVLQQIANVSINPAKPLKWQLRLADRSTAGVNLEAHYQIPPKVLFDLLADPLQHERIFDEIEAADAELLEDNGIQKKWRLDYSARWSFWKVSGICENRLWMWTDRDAGTVTFKLREPGFLRRYEGTWTIKAACGTPLSACYAPPDAVAAASLSSSPSGSSRFSSPMSSPPGSPRGGAGSTQGPGTPSLWGSFSGVSSLHGTDMAAVPAASSSNGMVVSPLASLNVLDAGAGLKGAVAAIARMQAAFLESMNNSATNFSSLATNAANSLSSSGLAALPQSIPRPINTSTPISDQQQQQLQRHWEPRQLPTSSIITAETFTSPKITPPYPLNSLLKNQSKGQVDDMLQGLVRAAVVQLQTQPLQGV